MSLDGFIEGPNGEYDWCFTDQDYGMTNFLGNTDAIFFGRKSYNLLMMTDENPYPDKTKYVFSRSLTEVEDAIIIKENIAEKVKEIKNAPGKNIWLFGGAELTDTLMDAGLVDELQIAVHPIVLGKGKPLFKAKDFRTKLELKDTITYSSGLVQLIYGFKG